MKDYSILDELVPKTQALHRAIFDKGFYEGKVYILDKIKTELHATSEMHEDGNYYLREELIDEIIDKYREVIE